MYLMLEENTEYQPAFLSFQGSDNCKIDLDEFIYFKNFYKRGHKD